MTLRGPVLRLAGAVLALLLAGCVAVPVSGPVERHSPDQQPANPGVEIAPVPPAQGASPGLIVEGFLHAMATYQAGYSVARQFLTADAADGWQPETGVEVYAANYPPQVSDAGVVLTAPLLGSLDAMGTYAVAPSGTQLVHDFGLVRDADNQWRIARPPRGLLISQSLFTSAWTLAEVCFWDVTGTQLAPDPRFVRTGAVGLLSTVRAVLAGPAAAARDAYRAPLPDQVDASAVTQGANGVVSVELTGAVAGLDTDARRRLAAELMWSLASMDGVTGLRVRSEGAEWNLTGGDAPATVADFGQGAPVPAAFADQVFAVRDGAIVRGSWDDPALEPQAIGGSLNRLSGIAARPDGQVVAAITDGGTKVRSVPAREGEARVELTGAGFSAVRWTRQGELLVVHQRGRSTRLRMVREGKEIPVDARALPAGRVRSLAVAPDGVRVALVVEQQGRPVLGVAALVREAGSVRFTGWRELSGASWAPATQPVLDAGWTGSAGLLVLLGGQPSARVVSVDSAGAMATDVGAGDGTTAVALAAAPGERAVLRGSDGQTWRLVDEFTWDAWLPDVQQVALP